MAKASITSPRCTVCCHAELPTINHLLACGAELAATARRFGLGRESVRRHFNDHVSKALIEALKMGPYGSREQLAEMCAAEGVSVVEGLRALYASHHAAMVANREVGAWPTYLAVAREQRATLNDIGRITGELMPHVGSLTVNFNSITYLTEVAEDLAAEAADHPEALAILQRVLQRRMNAALPSPDVLQGEARLVA